MMKNSNLVSATQSNGDDCDVSISVKIKILSELPKSFQQKSRHKHGRSSHRHDEHATIFASNLDSRFTRYDASTCQLISQHGQTVPAILRLITQQDETVRLAPCLAASLGLYDNAKPLNMVIVLRIISCHDRDGVVTEAARATLVEMGRVPRAPRLWAVRSNGGFEADKEERALRRFFQYPPRTDGKPSERFGAKPRRRLLGLGSIVSTMSEDAADSCVRFYRVVDIESSVTETEQRENNSWNAFYVSALTHLVLVMNNYSEEEDEKRDSAHGIGRDMISGFDWRLPRPSISSSFLRSIRDDIIAHDDNDDVDEVLDHGHWQSTIDVHHPSARDVANAIYTRGVLPLNTKTCSICQHSRALPTTPCHPPIIHVIGEEENHVCACIQEAADIMGMRYLRVEGLAAFWAHTHILGTDSEQSTADRKLTGGLSDKLHGLTAALKMARRSSPCVFHVVGIDEELSPTTGHGADADGRREEELRILQVIHEETIGSLNRRRLHYPPGGSSLCSPECLNVPSCSIVPRTIVVLSSSARLPPGPMTTSLEHESIVLSPPDVNYARYLWEDDVDETFDSISTMLAGLSAREIAFVRQKFVRRWKDASAATSENFNNPPSKGLQKNKSAVSIVQCILVELEAINSISRPSRSSGGSGAIPLASASLPNVRWEDIGGLSSIRKEIMDAVELPLKYPELFQGSRRSGILLFGPPGTGKTLVAKAVARECGLPFLSIKGPELLGSYVGESEANVRAVFEAARLAASTASKPIGTGFESGERYGGASVLFFDELDSLAPRRGETGHGDGVMERVVATLLGELDGVAGGGGSRAAKSSPPHVIVIGATNRPDLLDPSLLRPGRFDRLLYLGPAKTKDECLQILLAQTRKFKFEEGLDRAKLLRRAMDYFPPTLSGADLSAVASGALMRGLKRVCDKIEEEVRRINLKRGMDEKSEMAVDVDDVMEAWTEEQLQPTMIADDFIEAARDIVPSITEQDLERFEKLRNQFSAML